MFFSCQPFFLQNSSSILCGAWKGSKTLYLDYQIGCPFVLIGSPPAPSPASECVPPWTKGGGQHLLAAEGVGGASSNDCRESLSLYSMMMSFDTFRLIPAIIFAYLNILPYHPWSDSFNSLCSFTNSMQRKPVWSLYLFEVGEERFELWF